MRLYTLAFIALAFAAAEPVHFEKPGLFLDAKPGDSRINFRLPAAQGVNYTRAVAEFRMHIGDMQPVFNCFVSLIRPGAKGFYALQLRADKSKTIVDKMNGTQYGEVAPWKANADYRIRVDYNAAAGRLLFDAWDASGKSVQHLETPIIFRAIEDAGQGLEISFGLDKVYDHAYYPPWTWRFWDLAVTLTPGPSPYTHELVTYKHTPGCDLTADVYRTAGPGPHPAILWLHGGALIFGHKGNLPLWQRMRYLDAGFTVIAADYRLGPETKLPEIVADVRDAWNWIEREGPSKFEIDPGRVAVVGHSAGAYLAQLTGTILRRPPPAALVSFYGYNDLTAEWCRTPGQFATTRPVSEEAARGSVGTRPLAGTNFAHQRWQYYTYLRQHAAWVKEIGGFEPGDPAARPYSPIFNLNPDYPPTLLIHGDQDTDVPVSQSEAMDQALTRLGVHHQFLKLAGKPHAFDNDPNNPQVARLFNKVIAFLQQQCR